MWKTTQSVKTFSENLMLPNTPCECAFTSLVFYLIIFICFSTNHRDPLKEKFYKSCREELWFNTKTRRDYINISNQVRKAVDKSGIKEGFCLVSAMHISASVPINDDEQSLLHDYDQWLEKLT